MAEEERKELSQYSAEELPPEVEQIIDEMPEEHQAQARQMFSVHTAMMMRTSPQAEMMKKLSPETLDKMIENEGKAAEMEFKDRKSARWTTTILVLIGAIFLLVLVYFLKEDTDVLKEIVVPFVTLLAGALGGYGFGYSKGKKSE